MLVLSRKIQESVVVGGTNGIEQLLRVTVVEIRGRCVRLGFDAGAHVPVHRAEVWKRISAEAQAPDPQHAAERPQERPPYRDQLSTTE